MVILVRVIVVCIYVVTGINTKLFIVENCNSPDKKNNYNILTQFSFKFIMYYMDIRSFVIELLQSLMTSYLENVADGKCPPNLLNIYYDIY